jgi:hypothetical protein
MKKLIATTVSLSAFAAALSQFPTARASDPPIFVCTDANGHKELTEKDKGNCKLLEIPKALPLRKSVAKKGGYGWA